MQTPGGVKLATSANETFASIAGSSRITRIGRAYLQSYLGAMIHNESSEGYAMRNGTLAINI